MRIRQSILLLITVALALVAIAPASAQTSEPFRLYLPLVQRSEVRVLTATADAFVFENGPDVNTGDETLLFVGNDQGDENPLGVARSLIRFDLPDAPGNAVAKATLRLYYAGYADFPNTNRTVRIQIVTEPWQESTVTWVNQPAEGWYLGLTPVNSDQPFGYIEIDATNQVRGWMNGVMPNHGIKLLLGNESADDWAYRIFASRETAYPPQLILTPY